jgi:hypothetical protein
MKFDLPGAMLGSLRFVASSTRSGIAQSMSCRRSIDFLDASSRARRTVIQSGCSRKQRFLLSK